MERARETSPVLRIRRAEDIHHEAGGWFDARWHFSFGGYEDRGWMGVGPLRVFNDDRIVAAAEWPMHPHRDIESLTYVVDGVFEHADSLGNTGTLRSGGVQVMSFSHRGAEHSERNGSATDELRFLQFWILPASPSGTSTVQQRQHSTAERTNHWLQVMGPAGDESARLSLSLRQDARVWVSRVLQGEALERHTGADRLGYFYVISGRAEVGGHELAAGDAAVLPGGSTVSPAALEHAELILVDVPQTWTPVGVWAGMR
jgi:redox-sensitive bicupin YhaK (pirin superfamily)